MSEEIRRLDADITSLKGTLKQQRIANNAEIAALQTRLSNLRQAEREAELDPKTVQVGDVVELPGITSVRYTVLSKHGDWLWITDGIHAPANLCVCDITRIVSRAKIKPGMTIEHVGAKERSVAGLVIYAGFHSPSIVWEGGGTESLDSYPRDELRILHIPVKT